MKCFNVLNLIMHYYEDNMKKWKEKLTNTIFLSLSHSFSYALQIYLHVFLLQTCPNISTVHMRI